jgi:hypothetical protein
MGFKRLVTVLFATVILAGCHSKQSSKNEFIPLGYYPNEQDARAMAKKQQEQQNQLRALELKNGTQPRDLPCGIFKVVTTRNADGQEFWGIQKDMTGCPPGSEFDGIFGAIPKDSKGEAKKEKK